MKRKITYTKARSETGLDLYDLQQIVEDAEKLGTQLSWTRPTIKLVPGKLGGAQQQGLIHSLSFEKEL